MRPRTVVSIIAVVIFAFAMWWQGNEDILVQNVTASKHGADVHVFMTIRNLGDADRLLSVLSSEAEARFLRPDAGNHPLPIPASHDSQLAPDGAHVSLSGLSGAVQEGRLIPLSLTFERSGVISAKARIESMAMQHGGSGEASICRVEEGEPSPSLRIEVEPDREGWRVLISTQDFEFAEALVDGSHVPGTGHAHLFVDGVKLGRVYETEAHIPPLPKGPHVVRVTLNSNDHRTYQVGETPVTATTRIIVD